MYLPLLGSKEHHLQNSQSTMGWRCGLSGGIPALQAQSPEFKPPLNPKNKVSIYFLLKRRMNVFYALLVSWMLLSNLWSSGFVFSSPVVFTHMSSQGPELPRFNLMEGVSGLGQLLE
jgi:hypothetical protein